MQIHKVSLFVLCVLFVVCTMQSGLAAACNSPNLVRCMDSACVAEASMETGARCAQCYSAEAQAVINEKSTYKFGGRSRAVMRSLGRSNATSLDMSDAPDDPATRYQWAVAECIKKITGCTLNDVSKHYDQLIEQSCIAVGAKMDVTKALKESEANKKNENSCTADINMCLMTDNGCATDWSRCGEDAEFDRAFSSCVSSTECGHLTTLSGIKDTAKKSRDDFAAAKASNIEALAASYATARKAELDKVMQGCQNNMLKTVCIAKFCSSMPGKCGEGETEANRIREFCKYVDIACDRLLMSR